MRGRPLKVVWQEASETLQRLYQREPDGQRSRRLHALWLLRTGQTQEQVASLLGVSVRTVQQWMAWYRQGGLAELAAHRQGGPRRQGRCRLDPAQQEALRQFTRTGTCYRVADAQHWLIDTYGIGYGYFGMWKLLRRLRLRPKRPRSQSAKANPQAQAAWREGAPSSA